MNIKINHKLVYSILPFLIIKLLIQLYCAVNPVFHTYEADANFYLHGLVNSELFQQDYIAKYFSYHSRIIGFKYLNILWAEYFEIIILHRFQFFIIWFVFLYYFALTAKQIGGDLYCWGSVVLCFFNPLFIYKMIDGKEHSFAFLILSMLAYFVLNNKPTQIFILSLFSAFFYPVLTPFCGLCFALLLIFDSQNFTISIYRRASISMLAGFILLFVLYEQLNFANNYGTAIDLSASNHDFPEAGDALDNGRSKIAIKSPILYLISRYVDSYSAYFSVNARILIFLSSFLFSLFAFLRANFCDNLKRRYLFLLVSTLLVNALVLVFYKFSVYRTLYYPFIFLFAFILPMSLLRISEIFTGSSKKITFVFLVFTLLSFYNYKIPESAGYIEIPHQYLTLYEFAKKTKPESVFIGFPGFYSDSNGNKRTRPIEHLPYLAKRPAFITRKLHVPDHSEYLLEMRKRMSLLTDLFFATTNEKISEIKKTYRVDYLIVEPDIFNKIPEYISPFDKEIAEKWDKAKSSFYLKKLRSKAILDLGQFYLIDLNQNL